MDPIDLAPPQWSKNQLRSLGERIRKDGVQEGFPTYDDVQLRYFELASLTQRKIAEIDWRPLIGRREIELTSRAKTIDTLQDKLLRDKATPLSNVQDLAGVRFEAEMSLSEQTAVADTIARIFGHEPAQAVRDYRDQPHSGYRAIHVWLKTPERVEVQIRTRLQGAWANLYEAAGDKIGRSIRYGRVPEDEKLRRLVLEIQEKSTGTIAEVERSHDHLYSEASDHDGFLRKSARAMGISLAELSAWPLIRPVMEARLVQLESQRDREHELELEVKDFEERVRKMDLLEGGTE